MDARGTGGRVVYYEDGEVIFDENSISDEIYIIESGKVELSKRIAGKRIIIAVLGKGDLFGETVMFKDIPRSVTATAAGRTMLVSFFMEELLHRMQTNIQFAINLLQALMDRLRNTTLTLTTLIARIHDFSEETTNNLLPEKQSLKLGEVLIEMGCLTELQLERTLRKQKEVHILGNRHKLLGDIMIESGIITAEQLRNALAEQQIRFSRRSE